MPGDRGGSRETGDDDGINKGDVGGCLTTRARPKSATTTDIPAESFPMVRKKVVIK